MKKALVVGVLTLSFCGYGFAGSNIKDDIIGTWAMLPTIEGFANVIEFRPDNTEYFYPFTCDWDNRKVIKGTMYKGKMIGEPVEKYIYTHTISDDLISVTFNNEKEPFITLKFKGIEKVGRKTFMNLTKIDKLGNEEINFSYVKTDKIQPVCPPYFEKE
ncbi:hypothetical protein Xsto_03893 [Xenorhabdus stockiae]|uniref:Lipocalin-like domain-containing protein n=1 Tax=Xenorhabdus stockiae TaxID=351614 RepID=A0A2D0KAT1_9GAMM|nr:MULTISPECIES: hypothetical protein [Xenorhabdus]PHM60556.1 hypothetical protein Xsto_03893 [Xenorhabdus stockiae]PHM64487.1 hypothetical protein Xekj_04339 [Xenorhabdus sp. KJ12.1]